MKRESVEKLTGDKKELQNSTKQPVSHLNYTQTFADLSSAKAYLRAPC